MDIIQSYYTLSNNHNFKASQSEYHRKAYKILFKNDYVKTIFTPKVFGILLSKNRTVLLPAQQVP